MYPDPKFIQTVPANVDGRDFVVGDLHGCFDELAKLMTYVKFDPKRDRLFSTGDLIDRGPRSNDCLALLKKSWFYPVLGNHEDLILTKIKLKDAGQNPEFNKEELEILDVVEEYLPQLFNMPLIYEIEHVLYDKIYILHAEILPEHILGLESETDKVEYDRYFNSMKRFDFSEPILQFLDKNRYTTLDYNLKQKLIWSRKFASFFYKDHKQEIDNGDFSFMMHEDFSQKVKIFCGHNVVPFPMKIGQQYYIDTGSALGYSSREINSYLFTQFGHEFFALSMVDLTTGICYGCISSSNNSNYSRGQILRLEKPIYEYNIK
jgi:hypothetical protein